MAGSLIKIEEVEVTSGVSSVTLGDTNWDNTFDVYMIQMSNIEIDTDSKYLVMRVIENGVVNTGANYDAAYVNVKSSGVSNSAYNNQIYFYTHNNVLNTGANISLNGMKYMFNPNNENEYTFFTNEISAYSNPATLWGNQGCEMFQLKSLVNGVQFFLWNTGNIDSGIFTLYGLRT